MMTLEDIVDARQRGERGEKEVSAVGEEGGDSACGGVGTSGGNHKS